MKILGLIPARGGSRRIPGKNMAMLGGKPLIDWTIEAAKKSGVLTCVVVSTDSTQIGMNAAEKACFVIHRPRHLANGENGSMQNTVMHALNFFPRADAVMLLQPTSPFRNADHIVSAVENWSKKRSLVSVDSSGKENGAIYLAQTDWLRVGYPLYDERGGNWDRFYMGAFASLDIDTPEDLENARRMWADA